MNNYDYDYIYIIYYSTYTSCTFCTIVIYCSLYTCFASTSTFIIALNFEPLLLYCTLYYYNWLHSLPLLLHYTLYFYYFNVLYTFGTVLCSIPLLLFCSTLVLYFTLLYCIVLHFTVVFYCIVLWSVLNCVVLVLYLEIWKVNMIQISPG